MRAGMSAYSYVKNPTCQRAECRHPLVGGRLLGHFAHGQSPCKVPGCRCTKFVGQIRVLDRPAPDHAMTPVALAPVAPIALPPAVTPEPLPAPVAPPQVVSFRERLQLVKELARQD